MEGQGMSLFQGAASIHINNSAQDRLQEQEEIEDQKRRAEELKLKFATGFDDFQDDDEASSVNSSGNHTLDASQTNGDRTGLPPPYIESVNLLKENQHVSESPKYCETPKNHIQVIRNHENILKHSCSPYGAGDGHNHHFNPEYLGHRNGINNFDGHQESNKYEKLQLLHQMRVEECQKLAVTNQSLEKDITSLRVRLQEALQEKGRSEFSLQEAHQLLASAKHESIEQEQKLQSLREKWELSEREKEQMCLELRAANMALQDAQQRLQTMKVSQTHGTDVLFREQQDRHREEVDRLQNDLIKTKNRLEEKDNEILLLEKRCSERQREKEEAVREKCAAAERAARELQVERRARDLARDQLRDMGDKLKDTAHELAANRKKLSAAQLELERWQQVLLECMPDSFSAGEPPSPGKLATLKEMLSRYKSQIQRLPALQDEIAKRDKRIEQLQSAEIELRDELEQLRALELRLRRELRERTARLNAEELKVTDLEMELEKLKCEKGRGANLVQETRAELTRELERCGAELAEVRAENKDLKTLYLQVCSARDSVTRELKDAHTAAQREKETLRTRERELVERAERERRRGEELVAELAAAREELQRANGRISELQTEFTDKQREFTDKLNKFLEDEKSAMRKEISACMQCEKQLKHIRTLEEQISKYSVRLAAQESNETLMKELKSKAEFFQKYILERYQKMAEQCSVATNTERSHAPDGQDAPDAADGSDARDAGAGSDAADGRACGQDARDARSADGRTDSPVSDEDELNAKTALMMKEKAIRDQIAEKFTLEMKTIEMNCARRLKEMETEQLTAVTRLKSLLERKAKEVDTLKEFILSERAKVAQIFESKENEISVLIKEHNEIQIEGQRAREELEEWRRRAERYKERLTQLGSLREENSSQEQALRAKVGELQATVAQLEQQCARAEGDLQTLQEKYKNVKRTVLTYRDYMAKKDKHITSEVGRIQEEYRRIFVKLQRQLEARREERRTDTDYAAKLNEVSEEFSRLAQFNLRENLDKNK